MEGFADNPSSNTNVDRVLTKFNGCYYMTGQGEAWTKRALSPISR